MRKSFAKVSCLDDKRVVSIGAGNEHSLFVTQEGKLYTAGYNDNGQCGMGSTQQVRQPTVVAALEGEEIAQVHVYNGCEHTLAVTREGKIFSFGYNYRGQLGLGSTTSESTPRPIRGLLSRRVVLAACSYHHSVMLCADGSLYSCGRNDSGQLGHGDTVDKKTPQTVISCPKGIVSISCGQFHTVAATSSGAAFVCGKNDYGQLGIENSSNVKIFTEIGGHPEIEQIVQVCCGYYHTLILSNSGIVAGFGRNDYGQLGLGHAQPKVYSCTAIGTLRDKGVRMVSAGCYHSVVITANGMLYVFGRNNHGQLATGDQEERHSPHPV
ncbi:regulator of chromosome condensation 1/beta-lactamase-inhibitor protein II, partial [Ochromonadaceae sp. CCMP2298]